MQTQEISPQAAQELARYEAERTIFNLRKQAAAEIERLIAFMDETDGYTTTELEEAVDDRGCCDNELEKNLSGIHAHHIPDSAGDQFGDLEDDLEDEPSLAAPENHPNVPIGWWGCSSTLDGNQTRWAQGWTDDAEGDEHDGREPDDNEGGEAQHEDDEPSLGWTDWEAKYGRHSGANGRTFDLEENAGDMAEFDSADSGIGDHDGLMEQLAGTKAVNDCFAV